MKFVDLFAGLGGFHQALDRLGHECVFASEIDPELCDLYEKNFGLRPEGDIREIDPRSIPKHDILCAGFPCQPFSKAGSQMGFDCPQWGDLIYRVIDILETKKPKFFIIENVPNIISHNNGKTLVNIIEQLKELGYAVEYGRLSPHYFGIPQVRQRAFIVGKLNSIYPIVDWSKFRKRKSTNINKVLYKKPKNAQNLSGEHLEYLEVWQEFITSFPKNVPFPAFPIWAMEFGATYPIDLGRLNKKQILSLQEFEGPFGQSLKGLEGKELLAELPSHARSIAKGFPKWKQNYIMQNRLLFETHKKIIDPWLHKIRDFPSSFQKLEWNYKNGERDIWKHLIQFRASGIRIKKPNTAPSLVATVSQVPIIGWEKRFMTVKECGRLQCMDELEYLPGNAAKAYKAFGNAVNVTVVEQIAASLFSEYQVTNLGFRERKNA